MQLTSFKEFLGQVISEGNHLQKRNVNGRLTTKRWFTDTQLFAAFVSILCIKLLPKGFTDNFSGYTISFLGIFIGLFSNIIISLYDKSKNLIINVQEPDELQKAHLKQTKNYLIQFTGLTSYSILLALCSIILLLISLSSSGPKTDLNDYIFVNTIEEIKLINIIYILEVSLLIIYRFITVYMLANFFFITIFSITSYFTFLLSEYRKLKIDR